MFEKSAALERQLEYLARPVAADREVLVEVVHVRGDGSQYQLVIVVDDEKVSFHTHASHAGRRC